MIEKSLRFSFAVMSGGEGRRFGADKTKAKLLNKPLYMYAIETGLALTDDVMLVSRDSSKYKPFISGVRYFNDEYPNQCPMAGMMTAAKHAVYDRVFVLSADAPLFTPALAAYIAEKGRGFDGVIPVIGGKNYNLAAIYSVNMLKNLEEFYNKGIYKLNICYGNSDILFLKDSDFAKNFNIEKSFININTVADMEKAAELVLSAKSI